MEDELPNAGRVPKQSDLLTLCRALNEHGARYVIVGGFAVIHHGYLRAAIEGVDIPFANADLLLRTKQTHREKDVEDRIFLHRKIAESSQPND